MDEPLSLTAEEKIKKEKETYERIHKNAIYALGTVGLKINKPNEARETIELLEKKEPKQSSKNNPPPLSFPEDPCAMEVIERVRSGDYWNDKHTLKTENLFCWENWEKETEHLFERN